MQWIFFIEKPVLSVGQFNRLSNIFDNGGQVIFGVMVLSPIISGIDKVNWVIVVFGMMTVVLSWSLSVWLASKGGNK